MNAQTMKIPSTVAATRERYYRAISEHNLTPLWEVLAALVPSAPRSPLAAALWRYDDLREYVMEAGRLISAAEAERRVLVLENPALRGHSAITQSLYAGLQLILPGEVAPAHRHTQSALRLIIDGEGAYTAVDGERTTMHRGDFIITPAWTWHDHGNLGNQPVVWLDGLDIPLVRFLDTGFAEKYHDGYQAELRPEGDALARYGYNMLPIDFHQKPTDPTRAFVYPYQRTREALNGIARGPIDAHLGHKMRYVNPATGASPMATMGAFSQLLPVGYETKAYQCSDSTVYVCLEGEGQAEIEGKSYAFHENDIFVVPSWHGLRLLARRETVLFSYSDRPVQQVLGMWREKRL
ncbi:MAG: gentisate 1,2-dioxygenase [Pseudomonadota bacterium]|nr:gentisate 1,2-dioxygenase [Pseudomonadota bacterium]